MRLAKRLQITDVNILVVVVDLCAVLVSFRNEFRRRGLSDFLMSELKPPYPHRTPEEAGLSLLSLINLANDWSRRVGRTYYLSETCGFRG